MSKQTILVGVIALCVVVGAIVGFTRLGSRLTSAPMAPSPEGAPEVPPKQAPVATPPPESVIDKPVSGPIEEPPPPALAELKAEIARLEEGTEWQDLERAMNVTRAAFKLLPPANALDLLSGVIRKGSPGVRGMMGLSIGAELLRKQAGLVPEFRARALSSTDPDVQYVCVQALVASSPPGASDPATAEVGRRIFESETVRSYTRGAALMVVANNGTEALVLAVTLKARESRDPNIQETGLIAVLGYARRSPEASLPFLREHCMTGSKPQRQSLIGQMDTTGRVKPLAWNQILRELAETDPDPEIRNAAAARLKANESP